MRPESCFANTTGTDNTAAGVNALFANTTGIDNTATGNKALSANVDGNDNTAVGYHALQADTGNENTATGSQALLVNTTGNDNTAIGVRALKSNTTGSFNIAIGNGAGTRITSGDGNIDIGNFGVAGDHDTIRIGSSTVPQLRNFQAGIWGRTTPPVVVGGVTKAPVSVFVNANGQLGTVASAARYKRDIRDMGESSQGLQRLRPVTFRYKQDPNGQRQYGLVAEEVAKVYPELVVWGDKGEVLSVQYYELIPMLLNEVQHQQQALSAQVRQLAAQSQQLSAQSQELAELKAQNARLQAALVQQTTALAARLEHLEQAPHVAAVATR